MYKIKNIFVRDEHYEKIHQIFYYCPISNLGQGLELFRIKKLKNS